MNEKTELDFLIEEVKIFRALFISAYLKKNPKATKLEIAKDLRLSKEVVDEYFKTRINASELSLKNKKEII